MFTTLSWRMFGLPQCCRERQMTRFGTTLMGVAILFATLTTAEAKRGPAPAVNSVIIGPIGDSAPPDPDHMGCVIATDLPSGKEIWRQRIYRIFINPFLEADVQWVFITSLARLSLTPCSPRKGSHKV
jgi:hypothetical protein